MRILRAGGPLVSVVLAAALLTGCGKDDVERAAGVSVAEAAERTKAKGTARAEMTMRLTGGGTPALTLKLAGVTALDRPAGRLTVDLAQFADAFERDFIGQGEDEDHSVHETLSIAWDLLSMLPPETLIRVSEEEIAKYHKGQAK